MKNRKCPNHKACWDYGDCEGCPVGDEITRLHKRIDRLKKQNEKLTINMNAYGLTAKRLAEENEQLNRNLGQCKNGYRQELHLSQMLLRGAYESVEEKDKLLETIKANTARGIFAEIEEGVKAAVSALQFENNPIHRQVKHETYSSFMRFVKTVEKKYIGEDTNVRPTRRKGE